MSTANGGGIDFRESTVLVPLRKGGEVVGHATIDAEDADRVLKHLWRLDRHGYPHTSIWGKPPRTVSLHRMVLDLPSREGIIDHIDRDPLNNRKSNLRVVDHSANHQNGPSKRSGFTSEHRNVSWFARDGKWEVKMTVRGRVFRLGKFKDEDTAAEIASIGRAILMPYAEADTPISRAIRAAQAEIPNERQIIQWPVAGDDAARIVRLTELCGDVAAAIARGHTDVAGELTKLLAATTIWLESLSQR